MATETSGDSTTAKPSTTTAGFSFRPSALSDVADKIWKKSADSNSSSSTTDNDTKMFSLPPLSTLSSSSGTSSNTFLSSSSSTPSTPFIFGKNISRRVAHVTVDNGDRNSVTTETKKVAEGSKTEAGSSNEKAQPESDGAKGTRTEVSFDTLAATSTTATDTTADLNGTAVMVAAPEMATAAGEDTAAALEASAAAYEAAKHQTQKQPQLLAPDEVKTGEEDEMNVVQASVKLYVFDTTKQSWTDRGLAIIRVNDRRIENDEGAQLETRIVVRLQGSLRVIVNTKLWPDMLLERVSPKRLRLSGTVEDTVLTANESEQTPAISIYLISASQSADIDRIERTLRDRLRMKTLEHLVDSSIGKKRTLAPSDASSSSNDNDQGASSAKRRELEDRDK